MVLHAKADLENLGLDLPVDSQSDVLQVKRGKGCRRCRSTGYMGREGVFEVLSVTDEIKKLINRRESSDVIKKAAHRQGMKLLRENALAKTSKGRTTYNEVLRCISQED